MVPPIHPEKKVCTCRMYFAIHLCSSGVHCTMACAPPRFFLSFPLRVTSPEFSCLNIGGGGGFGRSQTRPDQTTTTTLAGVPVSASFFDGRISMPRKGTQTPGQHHMVYSIPEIKTKSIEPKGFNQSGVWSKPKGFGYGVNSQLSSPCPRCMRT